MRDSWREVRNFKLQEPNSDPIVNFLYEIAEAGVVVHDLKNCDLEHRKDNDAEILKKDRIF